MAYSKRPCRICRRWFEPHARAGSRQRVCSDPDCQRERHRRADRAWHARHPHYDAKRRLREAAHLPDEGVSQVQGDDPLDDVDWAVIERAVGAKPRSVIEGVGRLLVRHAQDAVPPNSADEPASSDRLLNKRSQDAEPTIAPDQPDVPARLPPTGRKTESARAGPGP